MGDSDDGEEANGEGEEQTAEEGGPNEEL